MGSTRRGVLVALAAGWTVPAAGCLGDGDEQIERPDLATVREVVVAFYDALAAGEEASVEATSAQVAESLATRELGRTEDWEYEVSVTDDEYNDETDVSIVYATITRRMPDDVVEFDARAFLSYIDGAWRVTQIDRLVEDGTEDTFW